MQIIWAVFLHIILALMLIPSSLHAWAREGHEIIAMIAEQRLEPDVRSAVVALLDKTNFIEAASWANQVRTQPNSPVALCQYSYHRH